MRTAIILLLLLALAAIPGSVFPQRGTDPAAVGRWIESNPTLGPTLDRLGLFDVYAAPWFAAVYLLLMVSLVGCVVPRTRDLVRALRRPIAPPPTRSTRYAHHQVLELDTEPDLGAAAAALRAGRWRVNLDPGSGWLVAEKGMWGQFGNLLFHLALLGILVGVAIGGLFGWRGNVVVREGAGFANTRAAFDAFSAGRMVGANLPPMRFDLLDFSATFEREGSQRGAPRDFRALVSHQDSPAAQPVQDTIEVNHPLHTAGVKVFLLGHGYAPRLRITDSAGRVVLEDTVVFVPNDGNFTSVGVVKAPDADPPLALEGLFLPTAAVDGVRGPHSTFPALDDPALFVSVWTGDLGLDSGEPSSVFSLDTEGLEQLDVAALRIGESLELPGGASVELVGVDRWASFSVAHDPGKGWALLAALAAVLGMAMSLLLRRRRIWVRCEPGPDTLRSAHVAGWDRRDSPQLAQEVAQLVELLGGAARPGSRAADAVGPRPTKED